MMLDTALTVPFSKCLCRVLASLLGVLEPHEAYMAEHLGKVIGLDSVIDHET